MPRRCARRDGDRLTEAEGVELGGGDGLVEPVDLVGGKENRLAVASEPVRDALVRAGQALSRIENQHHHVGLLDRERGLVGDEGGERITAAGEAAGVDRHCIASLDTHVAIAPVTGQSRQVRDEGVPGAGQRVEQRGLADVGAADECERGQHDLCPGGSCPGNVRDVHPGVVSPCGSKRVIAMRARSPAGGHPPGAGDQGSVREVSVPLPPRMYTAVRLATGGASTAAPPTRVRAAKRPSSTLSQCTCPSKSATTT